MKKFYLLLMGMLFLSAGQMWADDKNIDDASITITVADNQIYSGQQLKPEVVVKDGEDQLSETTHYILEYGTNVDAGDEAGSVTIKGVSAGEEGDGYSGEKEIKFNIKRRQVDNIFIALKGEKIYTGSPITIQESDIEVKDEGGTALTYDIGDDYDNNTNATAEETKASVTITLNGNYTGSKLFEFTINPLALTDADVAVDGSYTYNGTEHKPMTLTVTLNLSTLTTADYEIKSYGNNTNATPQGTTNEQKAFVEITGKGNYSEAAKGYFEIAPKAMTGVVIKLVDPAATYTFTGSEIKPEITVKDAGVDLNENNYSITYSENTNAGQATIKVTGKGNYAGDKPINFDIEKKSLEDDDIKIADIANQILPKGENPKVILSSEDLIVTYGETITLVEGDDFTTTYVKNDQITKEAEVTLSGKGNYTGEREASFEIAGKDISVAEIEIELKVTEKTYTGKEITLTTEELIVTDKTGGEPGVTLAADTDYTVKYSANTNAGSAVTVTIVGKGDWGNEKDAPTTFDIKQAEFNVTINPIPDQDYEGKAIEPVITVMFGDVVVDQSDYILSYKNNDKVGDATVEIISAGKNFIKNDTKVISQTFHIVEDVVAPPLPNKEKVNILVGGGFIPSHKTGTYTVDKGSSFIFTFKLEDTGVKEGDIIFKVNGSETEFKKISVNNYSFTISSVDREYTIEIGLKKYTLTLPEIKGCTLDPLPGTYDIDFNKPFTFTLILDDEYDESEVLVLVNGVVIEPEKTKATSYKFTIKNVLEEIKIEINGVEANDPSSNIEVDSGVKLYTEGSNLIIETPKLMTVTIFTISGKMVEQRNVNGWDSIFLDRGIYVVKLDNKVLKIIIK